MAKESDPKVKARLSDVTDPVIRAAAFNRLERLSLLNAIRGADNNPETGNIENLRKQQSRRMRDTTGASPLPRASKRPSINLQDLAEKAREAADELAMQRQNGASVVVDEDGVGDGKSRQLPSNLLTMRQKFSASLGDLGDENGSKKPGEHDPYTQIEYGDDDPEVGVQAAEPADQVDQQSLASASSDSIQHVRLPDLRLHEAIRNGKLVTIFSLVSQHGVPVDEVDDVGKTPLHIAAEFGYDGVVSILISRFSADISIRDRQGKTARDIALDAGFDKVVQEIDKASHLGRSAGEEFQEPLPPGYIAGVEETQESKSSGERSAHPPINLDPSLHELVRQGSTGCTKIFFSLKSGTPVNGLDNQGRTVLHVAASLNFPGAIKLLMDFGADASIRDNTGKTARDIAMMEGFGDVVEELDKLPNTKVAEVRGRRTGKHPFNCCTTQ